MNGVHNSKPYLRAYLEFWVAILGHMDKKARSLAYDVVISKEDMDEMLKTKDNSFES